MYLKFGRTNSRLLYGQIPPSHRLCFPSCSVQDWYVFSQYLNQANPSSRASEHNRKTEAQQMRHLSWPRSTWPIVALSCIIFEMEDTEYRWNLLESLQITSIRYIALKKKKYFLFSKGLQFGHVRGGKKIPIPDMKTFAKFLLQKRNVEGEYWNSARQMSDISGT